MRTSRDKKRRVLISAIALALIVVTTWLSLEPFQGPLVHDSTKLLALHQTVAEHPENPLFHTPAFGNQFPGRILAMASFVANAWMDGEVSAQSLKITNLCIHILVGLILFALARQLALLAGYTEQASWLALAVTVLWLLAPVNLASSWYAVQRMAQLSAMFVSAGLLAYIVLRRDSSNMRRSWIWLPLLVAALTLATASKENGLLLIPMLILVEAVFFRFQGWSSISKSTRSLVVLVLAGFAVLALAVAAGSIDYSHLPYSMTERLMTQPRVIFLYFQQVFLPFGNDPGVIFPVTISTGVSTPWTTLPAIAGIAALLAFAVVLWHRGYLLAGFGILFFFVGHLMESTVIPLEPAYLHRNYLPSFGLYLTFTAGAFALARKAGAKPVVFVFSMLLILFVFTAWAKAAAWQSEARFHAATYRHHPESIRATINFSAVLARNGRNDRALEIIEAGQREHFPKAATALIALTFFKCTTSEPITAKDYTAIENSHHWGSENELAQALYNLGGAFDAGCPTLDPARLADSLKGLAARQQRDRGQSWHVNYFVALFNDKAGRSDLANKYLAALVEQGEPRAGLFLAERLLEKEAYSDARETLKDIQIHASPDALDPFRDQFNRLANRLESAENEDPGDRQ